MIRSDSSAFVQVFLILTREISAWHHRKIISNVVSISDTFPLSTQWGSCVSSIYGQAFASFLLYQVFFFSIKKGKVLVGISGDPCKIGISLIFIKLCQVHSIHYSITGRAHIPACCTSIHSISSWLLFSLHALTGEALREWYDSHKLNMQQILSAPPGDGISCLSFAPTAFADNLLVSSWDSTTRLYDAQQNFPKATYNFRW